MIKANEESADRVLTAESGKAAMHLVIPSGDAAMYVIMDARCVMTPEAALDWHEQSVATLRTIPRQRTA